MTETTASGAAGLERPEDCAKAYQDAFNAGDVDGLVSLFEPEGVLVYGPGQVAVGSDALRELFAGLLATRPRFDIVKVFSLHQVGEIALVTGEWKMERTDPDGDPLTIRARPAVVFRRQADGSWRFLIDNAFPFD